MNLSMYILVNENVKMKPGKAFGQGGHAAATYVYLHAQDQKDLLDLYFKTEQKKIILKAPQDLLEDLESRGYLAIRDSGYTQLAPNTLTCVNLGILSKDGTSEENKIVKNLKLYN